MTGEELYALYREAVWESSLCETDPWGELEVEQRSAWNTLAEKLTEQAAEE